MTKILWHVFADNIDDWFDTLKKAKECYQQLKKDGYYNRRIYKEIIYNYNQDNEDITEDCWASCGEFPY